MTRRGESAFRDILYSFYQGFHTAYCYYGFSILKD